MQQISRHRFHFNSMRTIALQQKSIPGLIGTKLKTWKLNKTQSESIQVYCILDTMKREFKIAL